MLEIGDLAEVLMIFSLHFFFCVVFVLIVLCVLKVETVTTILNICFGIDIEVMYASSYGKTVEKETQPGIENVSIHFFRGCQKFSVFFVEVYV